ncbi:YsnF/AvaK domain-containing protein [Fundicoccus sp. Sow4_H7]|uniref:YsnF/AvaK domain-containing protein n=1 Tax=Fundicoccus sp. Sow4_H7 TaxID=3438784 RepID=UPI003F91E56A
MARKYVYGVYSSVSETEEAVSYILNQGVPRSSVSVVGNNEHGYSGDVDFVSYRDLLDEHEDNRGFFARLFDWDDDNDLNNDYANVDFTEYRDSLDRGDLLVLVDRDYEDRIPLFDANRPAVDDRLNEEYVDEDVYVETDYTLNDDLHGRTNNYHVEEVDVDRDVEVDTTLDHGLNTDLDRDLEVETDYNRDLDVDVDTDFDRDLDTDTDRIRLHEERIHADVQRKEAGEVHISKEVVEETETIEVPVEREEIHIRRTTPTGNADGDAFVEEDIVIPVSEEEVVVSKDTVVTDEFEVEKTHHTDHETVTETTRREELDIDDVEGHVIEDDERL